MLKPLALGALAALPLLAPVPWRHRSKRRAASW